MNLNAGLVLEDPPLLLPWRVAQPRLPALLVARRERTVPLPLIDPQWIAQVAAFGTRWWMALVFDARSELIRIVLQPSPAPAMLGEPPPRAEQLAAHGPAVLKRREALVAALGPGEIVDGRVEPCPSVRWATGGAAVEHEIRWITERGLDDGVLDDIVRLTAPATPSSK